MTSRIHFPNQPAQPTQPSPAPPGPEMSTPPDHLQWGSTPQSHLLLEALPDCSALLGRSLTWFLQNGIYLPLFFFFLTLSFLFFS